MHTGETELEHKSLHSLFLGENDPNRYTFRLKNRPDAGSPIDTNQSIQNQGLGDGSIMSKL